MNKRTESSMDLNKSNGFSLDGLTSIVTGGTSGLGLAIVRIFIAQGSQVVILGRNKKKLIHTVNELGPKAYYREYDVTQIEKSKGLVNSLQDEFGKIDILVNNAGNHQKKKAEEVEEEDMLQIFNVHIFGAFELSRLVAQQMLKTGGGSIIFISSVAALFGIPYVTAYSSAKAAMVGLVRTLSTEWGPRGVRINAIAPGWIETDMSTGAFKDDPRRYQKILDRTPLGTLGEPDDVGWAAAYLASPASKFVTGICLPVDGGSTIGF